MSIDRAGRRGERRAFRPSMDGTRALEARVLLTAAIRSQVAAGGQAAVVTNTDGNQFFVSVFGGGTVRATPASQGRVNLIVSGTNPASLLEINQILPKQRKGTAHTFTNTFNNYAKLNIASINVVTGQIGAIEGYKTANLSGPITALGTSRIDRIAVNSILSGGSINTGGDLYTLDVFNNATFDGTTTNIGRDLNWFELNGNLLIQNNASFTVGRDLGQTFQVAKGSGLAGQGMNISGNWTLESGGRFAVTRNIPYPAGIVVTGNLLGYSGVTVAGTDLNTFLTQIKPAQGQPANVLVLGATSP